jgi:hypothetical protein
MFHSDGPLGKTHFGGSHHTNDRLISHILYINRPYKPSYFDNHTTSETQRHGIRGLEDGYPAKKPTSTSKKLLTGKKRNRILRYDR